MQHAQIPAACAVVIPAYNPGPALYTLVQEIRALADFPVVVVDDGSQPQYQPLFGSLETAGVTVLRHAANRGKGAALKTGCMHCKAAEALGVVTADADGQHCPADIIRVARAGAENSARKVILGVRRFGKGVPLR